MQGPSDWKNHIVLFWLPSWMYLSRMLYQWAAQKSWSILSLYFIMFILVIIDCLGQKCEIGDQRFIRTSRRYKTRTEDETRPIDWRPLQTVGQEIAATPDHRKRENRGQLTTGQSDRDDLEEKTISIGELREIHGKEIKRHGRSN